MATVTTNTRYSTTDWHTNNHVIASNAERQRDASHDVRQEARFLRNETDNKTKWDQHDNNTRLADRVDMIRKWKDTLERTLGELDKEIADLNTAKEETEEALESMNLPTEVNTENLTTREGRQNIDVVEDEAEDELLKVLLSFPFFSFHCNFIIVHLFPRQYQVAPLTSYRVLFHREFHNCVSCRLQEQEVIAGIKSQLQQKIDQAFEQICVLQEARQQILADLQVSARRERNKCRNYTRMSATFGSFLSGQIRADFRLHLCFVLCRTKTLPWVSMWNSIT